MSAAPLKEGDRVLVRMTVKAVDPRLGLVLAQPLRNGEDAALWYEPDELFLDHLTPPAPPQNPPASD